MKKIWTLLFLLLLLIIVCVCTHIDDITVTSDAKTSTSQRTALSDHAQYIEYAITQKNGSFELNGNFKNVQQQNALKNTIEAAGNILIIGNTSSNDTLEGEEIIALTNMILPHFVSQYKNGKIQYHKHILTVSGDVKGYDAKHKMQALLNTSPIATRNDTNVILDAPIDFVITKDMQNIQLSGTFTDKQQIRALTSHLRPSFSAPDVRKNAHRVDNGAVPLTEKILPLFVKHYTKGKIHYGQGVLSVEGMADSQEALDEMNALLAEANIPTKNHSVVDPAVVQRAKEAEAALLAQAEAQARAQAEAEAKAAEAAKQAEAEAKRIQEEAQRKAAEVQAQQEELARLAKEKARIAAEEAKQASSAAKEKISKLLKIENIAFETGKETLTPKGESTVDKLANILAQYPHIKTEIAGHTDSDGSAEFNQKLSQSRVDTVKKRLISKGIKPDRLRAKGYGESQPLVPNTSDENKQTNRRVEIIILGE